MSKISAVEHERANVMKWLTHAILGVLGWRLEGQAPEESKYVAIFAPHTSNLDAILGLCIRFGIENRPASFLLKDSFFRFPFRSFMRWVGAIPIDRGKAGGTIEQVVEIYKQRDTMVLGITPEGTRNRAAHWKTGFYEIALEAEVPILMCYMDFSRKVAGIGPMLYPSGDIGADMKIFAEFYAGITPKNPERRGPVWEFPEDAKPEDG